jgi:tripartite-type tricarboxylate transporter receptor subunit TctC
MALFILVAMLLPAIIMYAKPANAQSAADFYKGKNLVAIVFSSPGGGYDTWTRLMAPYLKKYTGADKVIVRNMPGAGGAVAWNYMYKVSKPNGLTIAIGSGLSMIMDELLEEPAVKYQFSKFNWLGRMTADVSSIGVGKDSPYRSLDDIKKAPLFKWGTTGRTNMFGLMPIAVGEALGAKNFKIVAGYRGGSQVQLATIRQEVGGLTSSPPSILHLVKSGDLRVLAVLGNKRWRDIPDVPTLFELVPNISAEGKKWVDIIFTANALGRIVITSPKVAKEKTEFLAGALKKALHDPELVAKGEKIGKYVFYFSPKEQLKQLKALKLSPEEKKQLKYLVFKKYS